MRLVCPACETGYQMADGTLGVTGRKVRCARCGTVWHAAPNDYPDAPVDAPAARQIASGPEPSEDEWRDAITGDGPKGEFDAVADDTASGNDQASIDDLFGSAAAPAAEEDAGNDQASIDDLFAPPAGADAAGEAEAAADAPAPAEAAPPTLDAPPAGFDEPPRKRKPKGGRRRASAIGALDRHLSTPVAAVLLIGFLVAFVAAAVIARDKVVAALPDFAGIYEAIGLPVNLRGMEITGLSARREMDGSTPVLVVEGDIVNIEDVSKPLPALRVMLKSSTGRDVYAWNYTLPQLNIDQQARIHFKTRLLAPPEASVTLEVRFTDQHQP